MQNTVQFLCVLQTHSVSNNQKGYVRYTGTDKAEVTRRCVASLVASMNFAQKNLPQFQFRLAVLDDHSDEETVEYLKKTLGDAVFETAFVALESRGIMPSILACYELGRSEGRDLVYFAQDDYLFSEEAILEMIEFYGHAMTKLEKPPSIYPYDDPYRYQDHSNFEMVRIVHGRDRHWRTLYNCASCFMTSHSVIEENWDLFYKMGTSEVSTTMEKDSINKLWQERGYTLFCPIPSLALHMQYGSEKDPFIDWRSWWDPFAEDRLPGKFPLDPQKKIIVNAGAGKSALDIPLIKSGEWQEVRVDTDPDAMPHIVDSMASMPGLPAHSVDAIWASHVLEHVYWHEIPAVIREFRRILKEGGIAIISVPDLEFVAKAITKQGLLETVYTSPGGAITPLDMLYGYRAFTAAGMEGMQHKTGFTAGVLERVLRDLGFAHVVCRRGNFEIRAFASDHPLDPEALDQIA